MQQMTLDKLPDWGGEVINDILETNVKIVSLK